MDFRALFVGLALLCLCIGPIFGAVTTDEVITGDKTFDHTSGRRVAVEFKITIAPSPMGGTAVLDVCATPTVSAGGVPPIAPTSVTLVAASSNCPAAAGAACHNTYLATFTFAAGHCSFAGTFPVSYQVCDSQSGSPVTVSSESFNLQLEERDVCKVLSSGEFKLSTDIEPYGPYADAGFVHQKDPYDINDVVYFPFRVNYNNLTISQLTFNTISVATGTNTPVVLYGSSAASGAGTIVSLKTQSLSTQLSSGSATVWFSVALNRDAGSPFADVAASVTDTAYTFHVTLDVSYKFAKRSTNQAEDEQLKSHATIRISNKEVLSHPKVLDAQSIFASSAYTLQAGVMCVVGLLSFFFAI